MSWIPLANGSWLGLASISARWSAMAARCRGRHTSGGFLLGLVPAPHGYVIAKTVQPPTDGCDGRNAAARRPVHVPGRCWEDDMIRSEAMSEVERSCFERATAARWV